MGRDRKTGGLAVKNFMADFGHLIKEPSSLNSRFFIFEGEALLSRGSKPKRDNIGETSDYH